AEEASRFVNMLTFADAGEDVEQLLVLGTRVPDAVRSNERQPQLPREREQHLVAMLFLPDVMPLQLDVRTPFEDACDFLQRLFVVACEAVQPLGVLLDLLPRVARLPFGMFHRAGRDQFAKV